MSENGIPSKDASTTRWSESEVDVRRYLRALQRNRGLMALIVVVITGAVLALSLVSPKKYTATASIVYNPTSNPLLPQDSTSIQRSLATFDTLLQSADVGRAAAAKVPAATPSTIESEVTSQVDPSANIIYVDATDLDPRTAADIANAVATSFLNKQKAQDRATAERAIRQFKAQLGALQSNPQATTGELQALQDRISALQVQEASAGSDLQLGEAAQIPTSPSSPMPVRNTILAFFGALFVAVLAALGRDQLRPGVGSTRELSRMMGGLPVLAAIPYVRRRGISRRQRVTTAMEHEAYQTLRAALNLTTRHEGPGKVILITSAAHSEGKTTVTARVGRSLARAGQRTLLVSADLRHPDLHHMFELPRSPGLSEVLGLVQRAGISEQLIAATAHSVDVGEGVENSNLQVLTSGNETPEPARLLGGGALSQFLAFAKGLGYEYILVDGPPLLGIADVQPLAAEVDNVLVVARLDTVTTEQVFDMTELLGRLDAELLGLVVIGARAEASPYYLAERPLFGGSSESAEVSSPPGRGS